MFFNKNAGDPTKWLVDFDTSRARPSTTASTRNGIARLTWQVSPRNKISLSHSEQYDRQNKDGGGSATRTPEAQGMTALHARPHPAGDVDVAVHQPAAVRGRLGQLPVALRQHRAAHRRLAQRRDDLGRRAVLAPAARPTAASPSLIYRFNQPLQQGFERHQIGTLAQMRASASYIPGSHSMKFGYQGNISHPSQGYFNFTPFIQFRFNNGIPNQLTQTAVYPGTVKYQRNILMTSFYAQDTYTRAPADAAGRRPLRRHRHQLPGHRRRRPRLSADADTASSTPAGTTDEIHWKDITPRMGAAYDLFGNGKTARQGQRRQVPDRAHREQQRPRPQPADPHDASDDADVERRHTAATSCRQLRPDCDLRPRRQRRMRARWTTRTSARRSSRSRSIRT